MKRVENIKNQEANYENFKGECPYCAKYLIYNRVSDLKTIGLISGQNEECYHCNKEIRLLFDKMNPSWEMLLFDCSGLIEEKKYMYSI